MRSTSQHTFLGVVAIFAAVIGLSITIPTDGTAEAGGPDKRCAELNDFETVFGAACGAGCLLFGASVAGIVVGGGCFFVCLLADTLISNERQKACQPEPEPPQCEDPTPESAAISVTSDECPPPCVDVYYGELGSGPDCVDPLSRYWIDQCGRNIFSPDDPGGCGSESDPNFVERMCNPPGGDGLGGYPGDNLQFWINGHLDTEPEGYEFWVVVGACPD